MDLGAEPIGLDYWLHWQVPVCGLVFVLPAVIAVRLLKSINRDNLKSTDLWVPCWRNLSPLWLLVFRAFAFASMAFVLYHVYLVLGGAFAFYFYTQWTFTLVLVYFALATIVSARGCLVYSNKPSPEGRESDELLKKDSKASRSKNVSSSKGNQTKADFLELLVQALYQTSGGAAVLTDFVFWCLLFPFLLPDNFELTLLIGCIHSLNAVFLVLDSALNSQPFPWFGLAYFVIYSVSYIVFLWILHACGFSWWPYPFLELSTPWAPLWYLGLALVHLPCYGMYVLLVKAKNSIFSWMFPNAFARTTDTTRGKSLAKKQT